MNLTPIINRLRDQCPAGTFRQIGGSINLDTALRSAPVTPSAFVMPQADRPNEPHLASSHLQYTARCFCVVFCVSNRADATGEAASADLESPRRAVYLALRDWAPDGSTGDPVVFAEGREVHYGDGRLWWADRYVYMTSDPFNVNSDE